MAKIDVTILDKDTGKTETLNTDGYLLFFLTENDKIKVQGKLDMKILAPILAKTILERMSK